MQQPMELLDITPRPDGSNLDEYPNPTLEEKDGDVMTMVKFMYKSPMGARTRDPHNGYQAVAQVGQCSQDWPRGFAK